ncbi:hypothetical protein V8F06_006150 [Rhypophila decipiens]
MRLINIHTQQLQEFLSEKIPPYYILSHTWENDEISYQDYTWLLNYEAEVAEGIIDELLPKQRARIQAKARSLENRTGYRKIKSFINTVRSFPRQKGQLPRSFNVTHFRRASTDPRASNIDKLGPVDVDYVWIDTCCINKESSAELSEAINSMYMWYKNARLCLTYLSDVNVAENDLASASPGQSSFSRSRWFSRGWTLQELISPRIVLFYNRHWEYITDRYSAAYEIRERTGVSPDHFGQKLTDRPISERMSWASNRETTRVEDRAYCLMGIFGVNMPLLYGEGDRAFHRLLREIANMSGDQSIFAWGYGKPPNITDHPSIGMFAPSPAEFSTGGQIDLVDQKAVPFTLNNVGLQILGTLVRPVSGQRGWAGTFLVLNSVVVRLHSHTDILAIPVRGSSIDTVELENIADGAVIFRAFGHPVRIPAMILSRPESVVTRPVIIATHDFGDPSDSISSADDTSSTSFDFIIFEVDATLQLDMDEIWPHCTTCIIDYPKERLLQIFINNQNLNAVFLRFTEKGDDENDKTPGKQYALALCLGSLPGNGRMGLRYARVFEWNDFARLSSLRDTNSLAGLLCYFPGLTNPAEWPPRYRASTKYRVKIDYIGNKHRNRFKARLELEHRDHEYWGFKQVAHMDEASIKIERTIKRRVVDLNTNTDDHTYSDSDSDDGEDKKRGFTADGVKVKIKSMGGRHHDVGRE